MLWVINDINIDTIIDYDKIIDYAYCIMTDDIRKIEGGGWMGIVENSDVWC